jgi:hypothetical protein
MGLLTPFVNRREQTNETIHSHSRQDISILFSVEISNTIKPDLSATRVNNKLINAQHCSSDGKAKDTLPSSERQTASIWNKIKYRPSRYLIRGTYLPASTAEDDNNSPCHHGKCSMGDKLADTCSAKNTSLRFFFKGSEF